ncbi:MAG: hypothetical protein H0X29_09990 [Parachlamydiaceae bacterium]|nr:hypothetical protein [Parachlamydiaceae bacterium]
MNFQKISFNEKVFVHDPKFDICLGPKRNHAECISILHNSIRTKTQTINATAQSVINTTAQALLTGFYVTPKAIITPPPLLIPPQFVLDTTKNISQTAIKVITNVNVVHSEDSLKKLSYNFTASLLSKAFQNPTLFLPLFLIPLVLWRLYTFKEIQENNIHINIAATEEKKTYQISIGKNNTAICTAFEVAAGRPIGNPDSKFFKASLIKPSPFLLKRKHKDNYTIVNINVKESAPNESLKNGPVTFTIPFSNTGAVNINHLPQNCKKNKPRGEVKQDDESNWTFHDVTIDLYPSRVPEKPLYIKIPLYSDNPKSSPAVEFIHIQQV